MNSTTLMSEPYNLTALSNAQTVVDLLQYADNATNNILFGFALITINLIFFMILSRYPMEHRALVVFFVMFILSIFLRFAGLITWLFPIVYLILFAGMYFYSVFTSG